MQTEDFVKVGLLKTEDFVEVGGMQTGDFVEMGVPPTEDQIRGFRWFGPTCNETTETRCGGGFGVGAKRQPRQGVGENSAPAHNETSETGAVGDLAGKV